MRMEYMYGKADKISEVALLATLIALGVLTFFLFLLLLPAFSFCETKQKQEKFYIQSQEFLYHNG
jgi:hypothetical protein